MSYLQNRVYQQMHLTPEQCSTEMLVEGRHGMNRVMMPIFQSDNEDNILINVYRLDRTLITYPDEVANAGQTMRQSDLDRTKTYQIKRFNPTFLAQNPDLPKYVFPKGKDTYPFFPPRLVAKYEEQQKIDTLFLTEGYFKAMCASEHGFDIVGLGSITLFSDKRNKTLYRDIVQLILTCRPDNIVVLYDGDATDLSQKEVQRLNAGNYDETNAPDLTKRPTMFTTALFGLRDLLTQFQDVKLYFEYVLKLREDDAPKGIDDLLCDGQYSHFASQILDDFAHPEKPGLYCKKFNLRSEEKRIRRDFGLTSPDTFYKKWADVIGDKFFKYQGSTYRFNPVTDHLDTMMEADLLNYIHVGNDFYLKFKSPRVYGEEAEWEYELLQRAPATIKRMHGDKACDRICKYHHYEKFINVPSHTNYQPIIHGCYNLYSELTYTPRPGEWPNIKALLNHIFGPDDSEYYKMILDYLTIMYVNPRQPLPVLCLVSKENVTGKSTFLNLVKAMFGSNCSIGGNDLILSKFNSQVAGKLAICIDETATGENELVTEKIKQMSTGRTVMIEGKGKDQLEMENFLKIIMCSNRERKFLYASDDDVRFWVIKVGVLTPEEKKSNPNIADHFADEVPAFINYLLQRPMYVSKSEGRMWFDEARLDNEALRNLKLASKSMAERTLREYLHDIFLDTGNETLYFDLDYFKRNISDFQNQTMGYLRNVVELNLQVEKMRENKRVKMPYYSKESINEGALLWPTDSKNTRPYVFHRKQFLSNTEIQFLINKQSERDAANAAIVANDSDRSLVANDSDRSFTGVAGYSGVAGEPGYAGYAGVQPINFDNDETFEEDKELVF